MTSYIEIARERYACERAALSRELRTCCSLSVHRPNLQHEGKGFRFQRRELDQNSHCDGGPRVSQTIAHAAQSIATGLRQLFI